MHEHAHREPDAPDLGRFNDLYGLIQPAVGSRILQDPCPDRLSNFESTFDDLLVAKIHSLLYTFMSVIH